ncbi:MAG: class I SAM-dependent methyltransferase [Gaiellaceae bacterium]
MVGSCPLDGSSLRLGDDVLRDNRFGLPRRIRVGWCPSCGLGVTLDPPDKEELDRLYAACYAADGDPQLPGSSVGARAWHRVNGSLPLADERFEGPLLDVGCNTGELLAVLAARGLEVVGLEPNARAAAATRAKGIQVIEEPIETADLPSQHFRSIVLSQVLEHVHDPRAVLEQLRPAALPGGRIYVVVPNAGSLWRRAFGGDWVHWHVPFHLWHHTGRSLTLLLSQAGFDVETLRTVTPGEWLLMSLEARRNRRHDRFRLEPFRGRFGRRLALAPFGRLADALGRGDALYGVARRG